MKRILSLAAAMIVALEVPAQAITYGTPTATRYGNVGGFGRGLSVQRRAVRVLLGDPHLRDGLPDRRPLRRRPLGRGHRVRDLRPVFVEGTSKLYCGEFIASPLYTRSQNDFDDLAVIVFDKPIRGIEPATLTSEGYLDTVALTRATEFVSVGYGDTEYTQRPRRAGQQPPGDPHVRHRAVQRPRPRLPPPHADPAPGDAGTCDGDSGGPVFLDGVLVAISSTGETFCKATNVAQRLDTAEAQAFLSQYV